MQNISKPHQEKKMKKMAQKLSTIVELGFQTQNEFLMQNGFLRLGQNLKVLQKCDGDQVKAFEILTGKKQKKIDRIKNQLSILTNDSKNTNHENSLMYGGDNFECKWKGRKYQKYKQINNFDNNGNLLSEEIKENINKVFLDGNNMLFVHPPIRKLCIKGKRREAEELLVKHTCDFIKETYIKNIIVVFDETDFIIKPTSTFESIFQDFSNYNLVTENYNQNFSLEVISARPAFVTSDDLLVAVCEDQEKENTLFVTSDKGLQKRLYEKGVKEVMTSGTWFKFLKLNN